MRKEERQRLGEVGWMGRRVEARKEGRVGRRREDIEQGTKRERGEGEKLERELEREANGEGNAGS